MDVNRYDIKLFDFSQFSRGKNWGRTLRLEGLNSDDLHIAFAYASMESSIHHHRKLYNFILCYSGEIHIKFPNEDIETIILHTEHAIEIPPQLNHQFWAKRDSYIIESYSLQSLSDISYHDIVRITKK